MKLGKGHVQFSQDQLSKLWKAFNADAICQEEANFFYRQLVKLPKKPKK